MEKIVENTELEENKNGICLLNGELFTGISLIKNNENIIIKKIEYKNGVKDGMFIQYNENGSIRVKSEYKNNLRHGGTIVYSDEKELMPRFIGIYQNDILVNQYYVLELMHKQDVENLKKISESMTVCNNKLIEITENIEKQKQYQYDDNKILEGWG